MAEHLFHAIRDESDQSRLRLIGELDLGSTPALRSALEDIGTDEAVTLDLSELSFIDSTGLHLITEWANQLNGRGPLRLERPSEQLRRILRIVALDDHPNLTIVQERDGK
jgi:anti-anti-sigma factor